MTDIWKQMDPRWQEEGKGSPSSGAGEPLSLDAKAILLDGKLTAKQYLELMSQNTPSREAWGGALRVVLPGDNL